MEVNGARTKRRVAENVMLWTLSIEFSKLRCEMSEWISYMLANITESTSLVKN